MSLDIVFTASTPLHNVIATDPSYSDVQVTSQVNMQLAPDFTTDYGSVDHSPNLESPFGVTSLGMLGAASLDNECTSVLDFESSIVLSSPFLFI